MGKDRGVGGGIFGALFTGSCRLLVGDNILHSSSHHLDEDHSGLPVPHMGGD